MQFGKAEFSVDELDGIAKTVGTHSTFGYYDVNAIQLAVDRRGYVISYFDGRKSLDELPLEDDSLLGLLINFTTPLLFFFKSRHWTSIRKVFLSDGTSPKFYFMDSKQKKPQEFEVASLRAHLTNMRDSGAQILILRRKEEGEM